MREIKDVLALLKTRMESHAGRCKESEKKKDRTTTPFPWQLQPDDGV